MKYDAWKRELPSAVDDAADVMSRYETQHELPLNKPKDATPKEQKEWLEKELLPLGDNQLRFVAFMAVVQFLTFASMFLVFWVIGETFLK